MDQTTTTACRLCGSTGPHRVFEALEMMYGTKEPFDYFECANCQSVQIVTALEGGELAKHYPENYYSFSGSSGSGLVNYAITERDKHELRQPSLIGSVIAQFKPEALMKLLGSLNITPKSRILDVGCGSGGLLDRLGRAGFRNLFGADAFIEKSFTTEHGARIQKCEVADAEGTYDLIMFHHSLEHMDDPRAALRAARAKLNPGGACLVRVPTVSSTAWEEYGIYWHQLDAPRHMFVPSRQGMRLAAEAESFKVVAVIDDSVDHQFWLSENYKADIPQHGGGPMLQFSDEQKKQFAHKTRLANKSQRGDQIAVVLRVA
jgi:SAM-dependent methyltransferase